MKDKKIKAIFTITTIILIVSIGILVRNIFGNENKEVNVAKDFIQDLADKDIIDYYDKGYEIDKKDAVNKLANKDSQIRYSVLVGNYGVDVDNNYNILGFSNKSISNKSKDLKVEYNLTDAEVIDEKKAIDYGTKYIKEISEDEFIFKEIKNKDGEENPYYIVVFYKCKNGYPIYKQEITTLIDKVSWKLQGYSNYILENKECLKDIKVNEKDVINIVLDNFKDLNLIKEDIKDINLYYVETEKDKLVLSYILNIKNEKKEGIDESYLVIIRADNGEIINSNLETMKKN
ncbi:hypothetical protein [Clostridium sp.]|uniref:hypothetical protein n=1 Tax=Clostridium sp. TaxID=1506 RepID=UPI00260BDB20|nr:hypothetical protein [Clostridium sp.]